MRRGERVGERVRVGCGACTHFSSTEMRRSVECPDGMFPSGPGPHGRHRMSWGGRGAGRSEALLGAYFGCPAAAQGTAAERGGAGPHHLLKDLELLEPLLRMLETDQHFPHLPDRVRGARTGGVACVRGVRAWRAACGGRRARPHGDARRFATCSGGGRGLPTAHRGGLVRLLELTLDDSVLRPAVALDPDPPDPQGGIEVHIARTRWTRGLGTCRRY